MPEQNVGVLRVGEHLLCRGCGYDLYTQPVAGQCPECGSAVSISLHGDLLSNADPAWLAQVARWTKLAAVSMLAAVIWPVVLVFYIALVAGLQALAVPWLWLAPVVIVTWCVAVAGSTAREPTEMKLPLASMALRVLSPLVATLLVLAILTHDLPTTRWLIVATWGAALATYVLQVRRLGHLMHRARQPEFSIPLKRNGFWVLASHVPLVLAVMVGAEGFSACMGLIWLCWTWVLLVAATHLHFESARELHWAIEISQDQRRYANARAVTSPPGRATPGGP